MNSYSFDLENYTDINFVTVDDLIWGMSLKKNGNNYLINPKNILNIIFNDPDVQDNELLESLNLDTSLEELTYIYEKHQVPLVIPKHFKIKISESDLPYNYKSTLCLVPLGEFLS